MERMKPKERHVGPHGGVDGEEGQEGQDAASQSSHEEEQEVQPTERGFAPHLKEGQ